MKLSMVSVSSDRHMHVWDTINLSESSLHEEKHAAAREEKQRIRAGEEEIVEVAEVAEVAEEQSTTTATKQVSSPDETSTKMWQGQAHEVAITACAMSSNGMVAITGDLNGKVVVWNARTGVPISELFALFFDEKMSQQAKHHDSFEVTSISTDTNGNTIVAGSKDSRIFLWQRNIARSYQAAFGRTESSYHVLSSVTSRSYSLQILHKKAHEMDVRCIQIIPPLSGAMEVVTVVSGDSVGDLKVWYANTGVHTTASKAAVAEHILVPMQTLKHEVGINEITYSQGSSVAAKSTSAHSGLSLLAVATADHGITLWDVAQWTKIRTFVPPMNGRKGLATFSPLTCELCLFDWKPESKRDRSREQTNKHASNPHEVLEQAVTRARNVTVVNSASYRHNKPPPRIQSWYVNPISEENISDKTVGKVEEVEEEEEEEKDDEEEEDDEFPVLEESWSTFASHPQDRLCGDDFAAKTTYACTASGGRFLLGVFEDGSMRGYDTKSEGHRCSSFVFPDNINCMAAAQNAGKAEVVCGDMHGRVYIIDLGVDLESTWTINRLNNANESEKNEVSAVNHRSLESKREQPREFFTKHRLESAILSSIRLERALRNSNFLRSSGPGSYCVRDSIVRKKEGRAACVYALDAKRVGDHVGIDALEVLHQLGLSHARNTNASVNSENSESVNEYNEYRSAVQILGTLDSRGTHSQKFAQSQIQRLIEHALLPAATESSSLVLDFAASTPLSKMIGMACMRRQLKRKKLNRERESSKKDSSAGGEAKAVSFECHLLGVCPLTSTSWTKEQFKLESSEPHAPEESDWPATLDRGHKNVVMLDYTLGMGEDICFLLDVQKGLVRDKIPTAVVLVRGGAEEKESLLHLVRLGVPVVVCEGSGGLADEIVALRLSKFENVVSLLRLKDEVMKMIVMYSKLHIFAMSDAPEDTKSLLLRLLR